MVSQPAWILESCSKRTTLIFIFFASYLPIRDEDGASCNIDMITLITAFILHIKANLSEGVTQGKDKKRLLKTGDPLYRLICTIFWFKGPRKVGCLRQVIP